ncbi:MAG: histidine kinase [Phaeodactylibacter sp.]|nr:histidine kinase [Phaeodactylibacter sp.]MCB9273349.1 histidine kinase [Lewinellaceae bacterium]
MTTNLNLKILAHFGVWLSFLLVYGIIFGRFYPWHLNVLRGLANVLPMAIIFYGNLYFVDRYLEQKRYLAFALANLALLAVIVELRVRLNMFFPEIDREIIIRSSEASRWRIGALLTSASILVASTFYQMLANRYENEHRNLAIIREQQEAQLQFLRAQINPHFLFNTLNNIYSLAVAGSDKTPDMVLRLSNLLRYVVYDGREEQVALEREARQIGEYIELFQMRSEEPLDISYHTEGALEGIRVEPMILIPIVENCFKHCDFDTNDKAYARIKLTADAENLHFSTLNSKDNRQRQKDRVGGVGLDNIEKRLQLKYPGHYRLNIDEQEDSFALELSLAIR